MEVWRQLPEAAMTCRKTLWLSRPVPQLTPVTRRTQLFLDNTQNLKKTVKYMCNQIPDKPHLLHMKVTTIGHMSAPPLDL